jgi:hypothetical protein
MEFDKWVDGYKVRAFPWIDGKNIYVNVQYYKPGTSISQPPAMDKSALIEDNAAGRRFVYECTSTCTAYIASLPIPLGGMAHINAKEARQ